MTTGLIVYIILNELHLAYILWTVRGIEERL